MVENFAPGAMERAKLGYDKLSELNPSLIMCLISLAGQSGPLSDKPGFDYIGVGDAGITAADRARPGSGSIACRDGDSATGVYRSHGLSLSPPTSRRMAQKGNTFDCSLWICISNMHESMFPKVLLRRQATSTTADRLSSSDGGRPSCFAAGTMN